MQSAPVSAVIHTPSSRKSSMPQNTPNCEFCLTCECELLFSFIAQLFHCTFVEKDFSAFVLQIIPILWKILDPSNISITSRVSENIQSDQIMINFVPVMIASKWCHRLNAPTTKTKHYEIRAIMNLFTHLSCVIITYLYTLKKKKIQNFTGSVARQSLAAY